MESDFQGVEKTDGYSVRAVERAMTVLASLADAERPQTLTAIAQRCGLSVTTTYRLLRTLQQQGLVMPHTHDGRYMLGFRVLELAHALLRQLDVVAIARPFLTAARDELNETISLAVRSGEHHVRAVQIEATQPLRRVMEIGEQLPLYAGSVGKVFLAAASDAEIDAYLRRTELVPFSETTPTDARVLWQQIEQVRQRGYAVSLNERGAGGAGVSAPVRGHDGRVAAAVEISGPLTRFTPEARARWIELACSTAATISAALGFRNAHDEPMPVGRAVEALRCRPRSL